MFILYFLKLSADCGLFFFFYNVIVKGKFQSVRMLLLGPGRDPVRKMKLSAGNPRSSTTAPVAQFAEHRSRFARPRFRFSAGKPQVAFFATSPGQV